MNPNDILSQANHSTGMTVPDGYFADFNARMAEMLPPIEFEKTGQKAPAKRSMWLKMRPYVYMAAMFAGIWCMMKMFSLMQPSQADLSVDNHPVVTAAVNNEDFFNDYIVPEVDETTLLDDLYDEGFDTIDFEETNP